MVWVIGCAGEEHANIHAKVLQLDKILPNWKSADGFQYIGYEYNHL